MKKKYIKAIVVAGVLSLIIIVMLVAAELNKQSPDILGLIQNVALSIFCSIVASILFCLLQAADSKDEDSGEADFKIAVNDRLAQIDEKLRRQNILYDSGIVSIQKKSFYDKDGKFWRDIIDSATNKLDLIGHSIHKWFDEEYRETFVDKIATLLKEGKEVRIILSGETPDMDKIRKVENKEQGRRSLSKLESTCFELRQIARKLPKNKKQLSVVITDINKVTYMYIMTDHRCFISPYIHSITNSADTFLLELETRVDYSKCFERDFQEMLRDAQLFLDLED